MIWVKKMITKWSITEMNLRNFSKSTTNYKIQEISTTTKNNYQQLLNNLMKTMTYSLRKIVAEYPNHKVK